ncbi:hypothetical protein KOR34_40080 [Posidoniimonas corsicana]|uniref:Uncharacterized protein n=1 Tax=Posidoniimonas corsicana TaxID=1938618 RepID=A0A5C5V122_9BACT|nr:hypothetical protein [Posidoniimonas corsicana]TWT32246.1 hypothetical protein KOR34_40080 [Posidoniimonas corsicana]
MPTLNEGDAKMLALILQDGECTAEISDSAFSVQYSWLRKLRPSTYFKSLAPGVVGRLMQLGGVDGIDGEATFRVGPGSTGTGRYVFDFDQKWVRIRREQERILILVRDNRKGLNEKVPQPSYEEARCGRCNGVLRTPLAKQCLNCGYDWH